MKLHLLEYFQSFLLHAPPYDRTLPVEKLTSAFDLDFEQARQEFQTLLTTLELPDEVWGG
jgi:hypothetical protein